MRIVGGSARGRRLHSPADGSIRPMPDRVRQAVFNILGGMILEARALDLFAGSGALGIEALSRGAARCVFVESSPTAINLIENNLRPLPFAAAARIVRADAYRVAPILAASEKPFTHVFVAPPYEHIADSPGRDRLVRLFTDLIQAGCLAPDAIFAIQHDSGYNFTEKLPPTLSQTDFRRYGRTHIAFLEIKSDSPNLYLEPPSP